MHTNLRFVVIGTAFFFTILIMAVGVQIISKVSASSVTVTATVTQTVTCTTGLTSASFGSLSASSVTAASPSATTTISTNDPLGMTLYVADSNAGLATTSPAYTIPSTSGTLSAGTQGYGLQATSTAGIAVVSAYDTVGNAVGALQTSTQTLASSTSAVSSATVTAALLATISNSTPAGNYTDSVTYSCTGN